MDILIEMNLELLIYGIVIAICILIVLFYIWNYRRKSRNVAKKVSTAKEEGLFEPVSLHPYIDLNLCIGSGACVKSCPEKDILGLMNGRASVVKASNCVGHGACFHACPVEAISLRIGTATRGVDLPHVSENFEANVSGIYIAGELGGMGLIKNSIEQGQQAIENIVKNKKASQNGALDVVIIGAGPSGISATLASKKHKLKTVTLEQDSLGGTVYTFPRTKIVMTSPMDLPLYGKVKLATTSKDELITLWKKVIAENELNIQEHTKVESIVPLEEGNFKVKTNTGEEYTTQQVLLSIGRRGSPRKLGVPGEEKEKVSYRLLEPELIQNQHILVVGGGDSAVESAMLLMDKNQVTLSYRKDNFSRIKPMNRDKINEAIDKKRLKVEFNSNVVSINEGNVLLQMEAGSVEIPNDQVYIFAGGELPTKFLQGAGVKITKRFGHVLKKHSN